MEKELPSWKREMPFDVERINQYEASEGQKAQLEHLVDLQTRCEKKGIIFCVYGGYGVDALYGKLTRDHNDFDLLVKQKDKGDFTSIVEDLGYIHEQTRYSNKSCYESTSFGEKFHKQIHKIEYRSLDDFETKHEYDEKDFFPEKPVGRLGKFPIRTTTIKGFETLANIYVDFAIEQKWAEKYGINPGEKYGKSEYNLRLFDYIKKTRNL